MTGSSTTGSVFSGSSLGGSGGQMTMTSTFGGTGSIFRHARTCTTKNPSLIDLEVVNISVTVEIM